MSIVSDSITCPQCGKVAMTRQRRTAFFMLPPCQSCAAKVTPRSSQTTGLLYIFALALVFYTCYFFAVGLVPGFVVALLIINPLFSLVPLEVKS